MIIQRFLTYLDNKQNCIFTFLLLGVGVSYSLGLTVDFTDNEIKSIKLLTLIIVCCYLLELRLKYFFNILQGDKLIAIFEIVSIVLIVREGINILWGDYW